MIWHLSILLIKAIQPIIIPLCFGCAWLLMAVLGWNIWAGARDTYTRAKLMHQIPCANCRFFTDNHRLKCTVHPQIASSEAAIDCRDFDDRRTE